MEKLFIADVFKDTGFPSYTFVEPQEYIKTKVAIQTKGKGLIVEGPSGIGKTTSITRIISEIEMPFKPLSARKNEDLELIDLVLADSRDVGTIIIDDFHLLSKERREALANLLKTAADENREDIKLILIGINNAGEGLIQLSPDLNNRIDTIRYESNSPEKIQELIHKGEKALNIIIEDKDNLINKVNGSFHITQILCKEICIKAGITETQEHLATITISSEEACKSKIAEMARVYEPIARTFATGSRIRREGRAPYLHLLQWLSQSPDWSIQMDSIYAKHPLYKQSVSQVVEKSYLKDLINKNESLINKIHYDENAKTLTIEDPKFMFYLKNLDWKKFASDIGFINPDLTNKYDFALSFAGEIRDFPNALYEILTTEYNYNVFYDSDAKADILGKDLEEYFKPIYTSEAEYIIVFMDKNYAHKVWTVFESKLYRDRFKKEEIIPVITNDFQLSATDPLFHIGYQKIDLNEDPHVQMTELAALIDEKIRQKRANSKYCKE